LGVVARRPGQGMSSARGLLRVYFSIVIAPWRTFNGGAPMLGPRVLVGRFFTDEVDFSLENCHSWLLKRDLQVN
jgi:hypothetical protein